MHFKTTSLCFLELNLSIYAAVNYIRNKILLYLVS